MTDQTSPVTGTFECPICGYPSPHYHSPSEKIRWHQQYRPIFEASILRRLRRPDQTFYFYGIDAIPINSVARNLGTPGIHARRPGDWAELRHDGGYVCDWLQTLWEIFRDGVCAGLVQHAQQAKTDKEVSEQVARFAIDGAIAYGRLGINPPPSDDHWLTEYWRLGRQQAEHAQQAVEPFQQRVQPWMLECFGPEIAADTQERNHRFLEKSLELVQSCGATQSEAHQLVDYVYGRPAGDKSQEVGGVMVTLAALCLAQGLDMHQAGETELARIWTKVDKIRAKQAAKPKHSPLPMAVESERDKALDMTEENLRLLAARVAGNGNHHWLWGNAPWHMVVDFVVDFYRALQSQQPAQADKENP